MKTKADKKESKVETAKRSGRYLRGTIAETLAGDAVTFGHDDAQLLKFHGVYQQLDRDGRTAERALGGAPQRWFMVRVKVPGGVLTADQYLALDRLAERHSHNRSLRLTSRQGLQFHGVLKERLRPTLRAIDEALLTTLAACGDVERNVMAPSAPIAEPGYRAVRDLARAIARELTPQTGAYHEIWLDGERVAGGPAAGHGGGTACCGGARDGRGGGRDGRAEATGRGEADERGGPDECGGPDERGGPDEEPLYGPTYLPRKFKTGIALPDDNSTDIYSQDVGLIAVVDDAGEVRGANVLVGGGLGLTHRKAETYARLGSRLGYVRAADIVATVRAVAEIFRDHGDRADRKHARLKYLVEEWGIDRFRDELLRRSEIPLEPWLQLPSLPYRDHIGPHAQGDGRFYYGVWVENGRIIDGPRRRLKTALRRIVETLSPEVIALPSQDLLLADLEEEDIERVESVLAAFGVPLPGQLSAARRYGLACPALPTCGLALAEAERVMAGVLDELELEIERLGLAEEPISVRMTGCPNGCARPYTADIGLVGRRPGEYDIFVGGGLAGDRLADRFAAEVPIGELVERLRPLLQRWRDERRPDEGLGDFYQRLRGDRRPKRLLRGDEPPSSVVEARASRRSP